MISNRFLFTNIKNILGWTTNRKIIVFSVDDYGNVRIASKQARENLEKSGLDTATNRYDQYDGLDTPDDLSMLFETLTSVKDKNNRTAVFTAYANCANIDFEAIKNNHYDTYRYELLPKTLNSLKGYEGAWDLWKEGMDSRVFIPQFHGREHLNIKLFNELLTAEDSYLKTCIEQNSFAALPLHYYSTINYNEAYCFDQFEENKVLSEILADGLNVFETVFGYRALNFNAPGACEHHVLEKTMFEGGIRYIDSIPLVKEHQGNGVYKPKWRAMGKTNKLGQKYLIRNCVFEPTLTTPELTIASCLEEIETAFFWHKPAVISSHRVNFTGVVEESNRKKGIGALKILLQKIVQKWPDVEFMSADELGDLMI